MSRQATIRNLRWRGITVTNTLKVCLMIIGCAWILYQFKYSHQKNSKVSLDRSSPSIPEFHKQHLPHSNKTRHRREFNLNQSTEGDTKNGGIEELGVVEKEQLEDASRTAREDSLKADDASSEVVAAKRGDSGTGIVERRYGEIHDLLRENTSKSLDISEKNNSDIVPKGNQTLLIALNKATSPANLTRRNKSDLNSTTRRSKPGIDALNDAPLQTAKYSKE
ncbi:uncharacterized protein LOC121983036 [Zingiber officinale]|uniref:uncharacterized protein LOC121983036 n=1 Tax=Zingiber officinale TaxID=94328 RepID=UPI001C4BDB70|nr:uncharacterized protein LOC121983036 [Zingiber officinale]XP_042391958.1 uncharacterized protein LOC121983036 [Zingiber officinale]